MTSPVSFNPSNWPHLTPFERQVTATTGPFTMSSLEEGVLSREAYFERISKGGEYDAISYYLIMGETPRETKTKLDQAETKGAHEAELRELHARKMETELYPRLIEAKKKTIISAGDKYSLWFDGKDYYYVGVKVKPESIKDIIKIWDALAWELVEYELGCERLDLVKESQTAKAADLDSKLKYLAERKGKSYKMPEADCNFSNRIYYLVERLNSVYFKKKSDTEELRYGSIIEYRGKTIKRLWATFNVSPQFVSKVDEPNSTPKEDKPISLTEEYIRGLWSEKGPVSRPKIKKITRQDIESGAIKVDCDGNIYDENWNEIGRFDGIGMYMGKIYSMSGQEIGYTMFPPTEGLPIQIRDTEYNIHASAELNDAEAGGFPDGPEGLVPFRDEDGRVVGYAEEYSIVDAMAKGLIDPSRINWDNLYWDDIYFIYDAERRLEGYSLRNRFNMVTTAGEDNTKMNFVAEIDLRGELHDIWDTKTITDYSYWTFDLPQGMVECE